MEPSKIRELKEKTAVYETVPSIVAPISWPRFSEVKLETYHPNPGDYGFEYELIENGEGLSPDYSRGLDYYVGCMDYDSPCLIKASDLPTEFFNHQLFEEGAKAEDCTQSFMAEWGLLFSPLRNSWGCLDGWQFLETMSMQGVKETDILIERLPELAGRIVSKLEAETTLTVLREIVLFLRKYIRSGGKDAKSLVMLALPLSVVSCNPFQIGSSSLPSRDTLELARRSMPRQVTYGLHDMGLLTSAICNQLIATIANEDIPWRECKCSDCDALFKYAQTNAHTPNQDAYYCCKLHSDRERQSRKRGRDKAKKA